MQPPRKALSTEQTNVEINCYLMNCLAGAVCESAATGKPVELCGRTIRYVTIIPAKRKNAQGRIMLGRTLMQPPRKALSTEQTNVEINCYLMNCLAGAVCESAATGKPVEPSSIDADV